MGQKPIRDILDEFESYLRESGIHAALRFLNQRTSHRFTGIYRFDPPLLCSLVLYDRENPDLKIGGDSALSETYCSIVGETESHFFTPDASREERLREHPARETVLSYCGVLLRAGDATTFGTLCHFDIIPRPVQKDEIQLLEAVAPLLIRRLLQEKAATASSGSDG